MSDYMRDDLKTYLLKGSKNDGSKFKEKKIMVGINTHILGSVNAVKTYVK